MIAHLVLLKPKADLSASARRRFLDAFVKAIREIPTVRGVRVGKRFKHGAGYEQAMPDAADYLAVIDFDNLQGLQVYLRHPAHEALGQSFTECLDAALVYDFDVLALEELVSTLLEEQPLGDGL